MIKQFKTLSDLMITFGDNQAAIDHFKAIRWRNGDFCPYCGHDKVYSLKANRYSCAQCRNTFSILVGTIFENTKLPLAKWFGAIWLLTNHPKGIASTTLAKDLGVTQKTAWFILHRLRHAARTQSFNSPLSGTVEVDETYVGGKSINRHKNERRRRKGNAGVVNKTPVIGAVERGGDVVALRSAVWGRRSRAFHKAGGFAVCRSNRDGCTSGLRGHDRLAAASNDQSPCGRIRARRRAYQYD